MNCLALESACLETSGKESVPSSSLICERFWNMEVVFSAQYTVNQSFSVTPLHSSSEIVVTFGNEVSLEFVKEIYTSVFQTFRYITRRNNIVFDSIEIFDIIQYHKHYYLDYCQYKHGMAQKYLIKLSQLHVVLTMQSKLSSCT